MLLTRKAVVNHLTLRVAWHDNRWNGGICTSPTQNAFCIALDRIREDRRDAQEDALAGTLLSELGPAQMPPCQQESGAFMSDRPWQRVVDHPYRQKTPETHGHLRPTTAT